ncbi:MAG TPA: response regulator [Gemmatimonadaceae bacterium]|nr:response regulator [Gemmatimonadaceae bacterium]
MCRDDPPEERLHQRGTADAGTRRTRQLLNAENGGPLTRILLVEDNELNRDMLSRRLQRRGYEVLIAVDGQQGVAMARAESPDLVLMDMSLPVMDGWEATRTLKAAPDTKNIPVIALTAHAMSTDRDKAIEAGCDDYDTKPIELPRLLGKIETLLPGRDTAARTREEQS